MENMVLTNTTHISEQKILIKVLILLLLVMDGVVIEILLAMHKLDLDDAKVAREIADSYLIARQWDQKHFKLVAKTMDLAHNVLVKWTQFDAKYKVNERVNATATSVIDSVKAFDEKHQLTRRLSNSAKQINDKLWITDKLEGVAVHCEQRYRG
eukprot:1090966_1